MNASSDASDAAGASDAAAGGPRPAGVAANRTIESDGEMRQGAGGA